MEDDLIKLSKEEALKEIKFIEENVDSDAVPHECEDELYLRFIRCIAAAMYSDNEEIEIAKILVKTQEIKMPRWYE